MNHSQKPTLEEMIAKLEDLRLEHPRTPALVSKLVEFCSEMSDIEDDVEDAHELIQAIVGEMGEEAVPTLAQAFNSDDPEKKACALDMMQLVVSPDNPALIEMVRAAIKHDDARVWHTALRLIPMTAVKGDLPILMDMLNNPREEFSTSYVANIVGALARAGGAETVPTLSNLLSTAHLSVIDDVINALEFIGTPEAIQAIRQWRESDRGAFYVDQFALMRLDTMASMPKHFDLQTYSQYGHEEYRQRESDKLRYDIVLLSLKKAFSDPTLSERAKTALEAINTPEARRILDEWKAIQSDIS